MATFNWNNELVFELIRMVEEKPELWNTSSEDYKAKEKKQEAWREIAKAMDTDVSTVERKMRMLVSQYRRELFSKRNSKWFAFQRLSFLKTRQIVLSHKNRQRPTCFVSVEQDREKQNSKPHQQGVGVRLETSAVKDRINVIKQREQRTEERDEYTTYGELVAMKLKKLGSPYARSTAQYHINNILYKAEIGAYDKPPRQNKSCTTKEDFTTGNPSANLIDYDVHSRRSSSPTKSTDYDLKFEESDENIS